MRVITTRVATHFYGGKLAKIVHKFTILNFKFCAIEIERIW